MLIKKIHNNQKTNNNKMVVKLLLKVIKLALSLLKK
jgi:hypothetical protein